MNVCYIEPERNWDYSRPYPHMPRNHRHANSERFQKMLEAPSAPEIKGELHNILSKPEEAGGETHRGMTRPCNGDTSLLRENEHDRWRKSSRKGNWNPAGPVTALFSLFFFRGALRGPCSAPLQNYWRR